jgi:DNA-binding GntR family transcriptional regulator
VGEQLLTDIAFQRLEEMIVTRRLPPGSMMSEIQLSAELGMGRTPIREALQRLRQIGFVEMHPRRGTSVCGIDTRQQLELLEVRRPLEELMVKCAAVRATAGERAVLGRLAEMILDAARREDVGEYFQANRQIHEAETSAAHNQMLSNSMQSIHAQSRRFWYLNVEQAGAFAEGAQGHARVLNGIVQGDGAEAVAATQKLMQFLERLTRSALDAFSVSH